MKSSVTPDSGITERTYRHDGCGTITVYAVKADPSSFLKPAILGAELFRITLCVEDANMLMQDLYYGEYTGG